MSDGELIARDIWVQELEAHETESCTLKARAATNAKYMKSNSPAHGSFQLNRGTDAILVF